MTYEEFLERDGRTLLRFATLLTGEASLAEDLAQETLLKAYQSWSRIGSLDVPWAYVRRMLVNEHVSWRRKWGRIIPTDRAGLVEATVGDFAARTDDHAELLALLRALPERQRAAIVMRYLEDMPITDIARVLRCREATVRAYVSKGLSSLRATGSAYFAMERSQ